MSLWGGGGVADGSEPADPDVISTSVSLKPPTQHVVGPCRLNEWMNGLISSLTRIV